MEREIDRINSRAVQENASPVPERVACRKDERVNVEVAVDRGPGNGSVADAVRPGDRSSICVVEVEGRRKRNTGPRMSTVPDMS